MNKSYRRDGVIPSLRSSTYPKRLVFFDTETVSINQHDGKQVQVLRLGVARYIQLDAKLNIKIDKSITFYSTDEFMEFIESCVTAKQKVLLFAHNVAFDIMVLSLPGYFESIGVETKPPIINGMMFLWKVKTDKGTFEFINTGNFTPYPLAKIGDDLHIPKLEIDFNTDNEQSLITYCQRDVEIILQLIMSMIKFLHNHKLGSFKPTLASQALTTYRTSFMINPIHIHNDIKVNTIESDAYHGGRTEAFYIGELTEQKTYYLDINSMYPYVMKGNNLPSKYLYVIPYPDVHTIKDLLESHYLIARCVVITNENYLPLMYNPKQHNILNSKHTPKHPKLIFPVGTFETLLHHDELVYALQHNHVARIYGVYVYERSQLFDEYVNYFNTLKIEAGYENNQTNRLIAKLFLNSLYGKFGQKYKATQLVQEHTAEPNNQTLVINESSQSDYIEFVWFNKRYVSITDGLATYSFPAIAGCITARARMLLWEYMNLAGLDNVYYVDTDSIVTDFEGYSRLLPHTDDYELGKLALEKTTDYMKINGAKDYTWDKSRVVKGVPKKAEWLNDSVSISLRFQGFREWRNQGMSIGPMVWKQLKIKHTPYDKGIVNDDNRVKPFLL